MTTKQLNIKDRSYYFYNDLINLWDFNKQNLKVDKKTWKDIDIYYLSYVDRKPECHISSVNQLYFIVNRVHRMIIKENNQKYLTISKPDNVLKKYAKKFSDIQENIKNIDDE